MQVLYNSELHVYFVMSAQPRLEHGNYLNCRLHAVAPYTPGMGVSRIKPIPIVWNIDWYLHSSHIILEIAAASDPTLPFQKNRLRMNRVLSKWTENSNATENDWKQSK